MNTVTSYTELSGGEAREEPRFEANPSNSGSINVRSYGMKLDKKRAVRLHFQIAYYPIKRPVCRAPILTNRLQQTGSRPCSVSRISPAIGTVHHFLTGSPGYSIPFGRFEYQDGLTCLHMTTPMSNLFLALPDGGGAPPCRSRVSLRGTLNQTSIEAFRIRTIRLCSAILGLWVRHHRRLDAAAELVMKRWALTTYHARFSDLNFLLVTISYFAFIRAPVPSEIR
ncbi:uncharacterized protein K460DRAFT_78681 [Cucurbitaria berberidis CBS 394.84]|uniref:Uncharacterized protein n=1 Tax=Cucurbitaria berberidis CBS 394.84 TaxID=1168544 RepID=A0A9P4LBS0_9PLEO|nr:uncharacterized protein K460DRAFT_78681 [Cucurbitaria berberidis CBS 394.84]KAF1848632.1 hypothetical protein K460DRAFT_78681 [Cucurbitaria berberidis CBS 394.84]